LPAPAQQASDVPADPDVAVQQQGGTPVAGLRNRGKHGLFQRTGSAAARQANGLGAGIDA